MGDSASADNIVADADEDRERKLKEWEEAVCPICLETPHNAVMLQCSSNGCRPYICNTRDRHSGCLKKLFKTWTRMSRTCPFCRGRIKGWELIDSAARKYMNSKQRSCYSCESFSGDYAELRKHLRSEHPLATPIDADLGFALTGLRTLSISSLEQETRDIFDIDSTASRPSVLEWSSSSLMDRPIRMTRTRSIMRKSDMAAGTRRANGVPSRRILRGPRNF